MNRTRVRTRRAKHMRTDAHNLACVRDPALERLLGHTASLADRWCSRAPDSAPTLLAGLAVADRLHRSTGELTAWELARPAGETGLGQAIGL